MSLRHRWVGLLAVGACLSGVARADSTPLGGVAQGSDAYSRSLELSEARRFAEALEAAEQVGEPLCRGRAELIARFGARDFRGGIAAAARTLDGRLDDLDQLVAWGSRDALILMHQAASASLRPYGDAEAVDAWCDALEEALVIFKVEGPDRKDWDAAVLSFRTGAEERRGSIDRRSEALARAQATLGWGMGGLVLILLLLALLPMPGRGTTA